MTSDEHAILTGALRVIKRRGWCQQAYQDADGRVCLLEAIWIAAGAGAYGPHDTVPDDLVARIDAACEQLRPYLGRMGDGFRTDPQTMVLRYSDFWLTVCSDVIGVLEEATTPRQAALL